MEELLAALGVIGTLAGTVLGWYLNERSKRGKLLFIVKQMRFFGTETNDLIGLAAIEYLHFQPNVKRVDCVFQIYNSSSINRVLYDIRYKIGNSHYYGGDGSPEALNLEPYKLDFLQVSIVLREEEIDQYEGVTVLYRNEKNKWREIKLRNPYFQFPPGQ